MFSVQNLPHLHQGFSWFPISMEGCTKESESEEYVDDQMAESYIEVILAQYEKKTHCL